MKIALSVLCLISSAIAFEIGKIDPLSDEFIDLINSKQNSWVAGKNFPAMRDIRNLLGARISDLSLKYKPTVHTEYMDIPESFDARNSFSKCKNVIGTIVDQAACGSCWAVAAASAMSDRRCIQSNGNITVPVSSLDLLSCCEDCGNGCQGGWSDRAFDYWRRTGIVTGGLYDSNQGCKPYSMKNCDHHVNGKYEPCPSGLDDTPACKRTCSVQGLDYKSENTYGETGVQYFNTVEDIQKEIMSNGPVVASFNVYSDFLQYKSGVYQHVAGGYKGGHAVRIVGWGVDEASKLPYWLVANSWNEDWGEKGLFKIVRGTNECGFESQVVAGLAKV